ncbi:MAG: ATP-binding protein [Bdellovibrionales bacterium]|nr:ATP-binding protein [Bdellovibrionales bacterium]
MKLKPLFWQLYPAFLVTSLLGLILVTIIACVTFHHFYLEKSLEDLQTRAQILSGSIKDQDVKSSTFQQRVVALGQQIDKHISVIDFDGHILADSHRPKQIGKSVLEDPEVYQALNSVEGAARAQRYQSFFKKEYLYFVTKQMEITKTPYLIRVGLPIDSIYQALKSIYLKVFIGACVVIILVALISLYFVYKLTLPIEAIRKWATQVATGDLSLRINTKNVYTKEVKSLAQAMNKMAFNLKKRMQTIHQQNNEQQAIFASMSEGVLAVDTKQRVQLINHAAKQLLQISGIDCISTPIQELIRSSEILQFIKDSLELKAPRDKEIKVFAETEKIFKVTSTPLILQKGKFIGCVVVFSDQTQIRKLEQHRKEFVANVSHELRTPLTSIKGYAETLKNTAVDDENQQKFLDIIIKQSSRLGDSIDELLTLSRMDKESKLELEKGSLKQVLESAIEVCRPKAEVMQQKLSFTDETNNAYAYIHPHMLERAVVNLIDNAVKYSGANTQIDVILSKKDQYFSISVIDEGPGIEQKHQDRLFERFYRVDESRNSKVGGSGLGLSIVKHVALSHGGFVEVESHSGKGSLFRICLPVS